MLSIAAMFVLFYSIMACVVFSASTIFMSVIVYVLWLAAPKRAQDVVFESFIASVSSCLVFFFAVRCVTLCFFIKLRLA